MEGSESGADMIVQVVLAYQARMCKSPSQCETAQPTENELTFFVYSLKVRKCDHNHHAQPCSPVDVSGRRGSSRPVFVRKW